MGYVFNYVLRKSNALVNSDSDYDVNKHLRWQDINFFKWGITVRVPYPKVIQFQSRITDMPFPRAQNNHAMR